MTVIVGLLCSEGIVIASDGQESDEETGLKRLDVKKVFDTTFFDLDQGDIELVVAGTGSSAHIARVAELIDEKVFGPRFSLPRQVANVTEDALGDMKKRYGADLDLEVLVGAYCKDAPKHGDEAKKLPSPVGLYRILAPSKEERVGVAESVMDYAALGTGGAFAHYLLHRLHDEDNPVKALTMEAAIREAIYAVSEAMKVDLWCGGDIQVACIQRRDNPNQGRAENKTDENEDERTEYDLRRLRPEEIRDVLATLTTADKEIKKNQREMLGGRNRIASGRTKLGRAVASGPLGGPHS